MMKARDTMEGELVETLLGLIRQNFEEYGYLTPVIFVVPGLELGVPFCILDASKFMTGEAGKDALAEVTRTFCAEVKAVSAILATEVWTLPPGHPASLSHEAMAAEYERYGGLANHPDRVEAVSVSVESRSGCCLYMAKISRAEDRPGLGEWEKLEGNERSSGRFVGFLPVQDAAN